VQIFANLLPLYGDLYLLGDFNINLILHLVIFLGLHALQRFKFSNQEDFRQASRTFFCFKSNEVEVVDFFQVNVPWSDHDFPLLPSLVG
jgi:hypothetical protein